MKIHFYSVLIKIKYVLFMKTCNLEFLTVYTFKENMQYTDTGTEYICVY